MRYDVVLVGFRLNARLKPAQALQTVLGLDSEACRALTQKFPATVLTGVSQSRADKVVEQLTELGAKAEAQPSRISLASEPEREGQSIRPFPQDEESGNYAIGEILAPMTKQAVSAPPEPLSEEAPPAKRATREELDQALRDSFRPNEPHGGEHDPAFAGLQNFDDTLGGFDKKAPTLEVDEVALRSIQRRADPSAGKGRPTKLSVRRRLVKFLRQMLSTSFDWSMGLLSLAVVTAVTLYAVGYALDPEHAITTLTLEQLPAPLQRATGSLLGK